MRIKRLDINGFKSFPDKVTLMFDQPIVGVVGPNGCGKSNIVDAIRWVMGEQSIKALRGSGREDVIFSGSESRAPLGVAEVTLTFDNRDKLAPSEYAEYPEIAVCRRLYRDGSSDYQINNAPCRLRDITELFLGTGAGNKAYSIIEQGRISLIVSAKPEDRRLMIEEAAGITKYHARKREAERKMAATQQNLTRIGDIIAELRKQLNSLSRQAKKAERYRDLKKRLKEIDLRFTGREYAEVLDAIEQTAKAVTELSERQAGMGGKIVAMEGEVDARNLKLAARERELNDWQEIIHGLDQSIRLDERNIEVFSEELQRISEREVEIDNELDGLDQTLKEQRERVTDLEGEQQRALAGSQEGERIQSEAEERYRLSAQEFDRQQQEIDRSKRAIFEHMAATDRALHKLETLRNRLTDNTERAERNRRERQDVERKLTEFETSRKDFVDALGGLRQMKLKLESARNEKAETLERERNSYLDTEERLTAERDRLTASRSRLDSLRELDEALEGFGDSVKKLLSPDGDGPGFGDGEVVDALARLVKVDPAYERAVGTLLGERLQWLVVTGQEAGRKGVAWLKKNDAGRAAFLPQDAPQPEAPATLGDGALPLAEVVSAAGVTESVVKRMLEDAYMVDDLDTACRLWRETGGRYRFVTPEGDFVDASGAVGGGSGDQISQTLLKRRREMEELEAVGRELGQVCERLARERDERVQLIRQLEGHIETVRQDSHRQEMKILEQEKDINRIEFELGQFQRQLDSLDREYVGLKDEARQFELERDELEVERKTAHQRREESEAELKAMQETLDEKATQREEASRRLTETRVKTAEALQRRQHLESDLRLARERETDLAGRSERLAFERRRGAERREELTRELATTRVRLEELIKRSEREQDKLRDARNALAEEQETIRGFAEGVRVQRKELDAIRAELSEKQIAQKELGLRAEHLIERVDERYGITLPTEYTEYLDDPAPGDDERSEMEDIRLRIERMGEVNLTAIGEHDSVSERYQFLCDQEDDLTRSMSMLQEAVDKINRTTRKRFKETFDEVNTRFSKLFPELFGGGEAELMFTDPNNLLQTGIEIVARPPGKKQQPVSLLSGGEKALTAVSMIFAIFLYRPTPFCLLDEVDAPLDDVNIGRFIATIKRISKTSQFILITHNKKTMEISNTLYGVTMEEPGISKIVSVNLT